MNKIYYFFFLGAILLIVSCTSEIKYDTSVVRNYEFSLNDESWALNTGLSSRPIFIYNSKGEFRANYSPFYRFSLENGTYYFLATPSPTNILPDSLLSTNLVDLIINQPKNADMDIQISEAMEHSSPFDEMIQFKMKNRTGTLRLKSMDLISDDSYNIVKATVISNRSGYKVFDSSYIDERVELSRSKTTSTGGVNYTDDFILLETGENGVSILIEMIDNDGNVVRKMEIDNKFLIASNEVTLVEFYLNGETDNN